MTRLDRVGGSPALLIGTSLVAGLIAIVVLIVVAAISDDEQVARPPGPPVACNGHEELCDRPLDQVSFPTTHNSMSASLDGFVMANQRHGIARQLDDGIRAFQIDTYYGVESDGTVLTDVQGEITAEEIERSLGTEGLEAIETARGGLAFDEAPDGETTTYLCHKMCEAGSVEFTETLTEMREFLATHPDELIILFIEDVVVPEDAATAFEESGLLRYAYVHRPGEPFPTLGELIEENRRLLVLGEDFSGGGEFPWYHEGFELVQETPYAFEGAADLADPASCMPNRGLEASPLFQFNNWVSELPRTPEAHAEVNEFDVLLERAERCEGQRNLLPNLVAVDYYDEGDVFGVVNVLNGLDPDVVPSTRSLD